jgi:hypothetical protein
MALVAPVPSALRRHDRTQWLRRLKMLDWLLSLLLDTDAGPRIDPEG